MTNSMCGCRRGRSSRRGRRRCRADGKDGNRRLAGVRSHRVCANRSSLFPFRATAVRRLLDPPLHSLDAADVGVAQITPINPGGERFRDSPPAKDRRRSAGP